MSQSGRGYDISRCLIYSLQLDEPLNQVYCLLRASFLHTLLLTMLQLSEYNKAFSRSLGISSLWGRSL